MDEHRQTKRDDPHANAFQIVVLIVEDEPIIRWAGADMLREAGFDVVEAVGADEALRILQAREDVCVLFTDVDMPGSIDGLELAHAARRLRPSLCILVTSGKSALDAHALPQHGRFVDKPYAQERIVRDIGRLLAPQA